MNRRPSPRPTISDLPIDHDDAVQAVRAFIARPGVTAEEMARGREFLLGLPGVEPAPIIEEPPIRVVMLERADLAIGLYQETEELLRLFPVDGRLAHLRANALVLAYDVRRLLGLPSPNRPRR